MAKKAKLKVKPCPYGCKSTVKDINVSLIAEDVYGVVCKTCGAIGPISDDPKDALDAWNRRTVILLSQEEYDKAKNEVENG